MTATAGRRTVVRVALSVWLVYAAHATTNVVRETYLAVAIATDLTVRVDPYLGLHPDLFEIPGRGAYINSNPGAGILGAVPYALARPAISGLFALKPSLGAAKPPTGYADPRPNRTRLMNEMRARGLDVRLALAALVTQVGLMAPLGALAAAVLFRFLCVRMSIAERPAMLLSLLYAFGTPVFFRSGFLNQNALLAHAVLFAWMTVTWPGPQPADRAVRWIAVGMLLGVGLLLDYSAAPLAICFGLFALVEGFRAGGTRAALLRGGACAAGSIVPLLGLWAYQWVAFGSPWFPAQRYMPETSLSVVGWNGLSLPSVELLWRNLLDPRYGLLAFCPLLILAAAAPFRRAGTGAERLDAAFALWATAALWLFSSANQFAHLQWNTGVRYMVPVVPLLFIALVPSLLAMRPWARTLLVVPTLLISFAVSMTREDVPTAIRLLATEGPTLPLLVVLNKTAAAYAPFLGGGVQPWGALAVTIVALAVAAIWRFAARPASS